MCPREDHRPLKLRPIGNWKSVADRIRIPPGVEAQAQTCRTTAPRFGNLPTVNLLLIGDRQQMDHLPTSARPTSDGDALFELHYVLNSARVTKVFVCRKR